MGDGELRSANAAHRRQPLLSLRGNLPPSSRDLEAAEESEDAERLIAGT